MFIIYFNIITHLGAVFSWTDMSNWFRRYTGSSVWKVSGSIPSSSSRPCKILNPEFPLWFGFSSVIVMWSQQQVFSKTGMLLLKYTCWINWGQFVTNEQLSLFLVKKKSEWRGYFEHFVTSIVIFQLWFQPPLFPLCLQSWILFSCRKPESRGSSSTTKNPILRVSW